LVINFVVQSTLSLHACYCCCCCCRYPGISGGKDFGRGTGSAFGFLNATEPWSGHYDVFPVLWMNAHWHWFAKPGWRFLSIGSTGGAEMLARGYGSYVTLVPPSEAVEAGTYPPGTFSLIVETLQGSCGPANCNNVQKPWTDSHNISFSLKGGPYAKSLSIITTIFLWCSTAEKQMDYRGTVSLQEGHKFALVMEPDAICTLSTINGTSSEVKNDNSVGNTPVPASTRFPKLHSDDFGSYDYDNLVRCSSKVVHSICMYF